MRSEEAASGFKRVEGLLALGDGVGGSDGGFDEAVGPVKPFLSLPEKFQEAN